MKTNYPFLGIIIFLFSFIFGYGFCLKFGSKPLQEKHFYYKELCAKQHRLIKEANVIISTTPINEDNIEPIINYWTKYESLDSLKTVMF